MRACLLFLSLLLTIPVAAFGQNEETEKGKNTAEERPLYGFTAHGLMLYPIDDSLKQFSDQANNNAYSEGSRVSAGFNLHAFFNVTGVFRIGVQGGYSDIRVEPFEASSWSLFEKDYTWDDRFSMVRLGFIPELFVPFGWFEASAGMLIGTGRLSFVSYKGYVSCYYTTGEDVVCADGREKKRNNEWAFLFEPQLAARFQLYRFLWLDLRGLFFWTTKTKTDAKVRIDSFTGEEKKTDATYELTGVALLLGVSFVFPSGSDL